MTTTTIRLPQELKDRIARAAARHGTTAHGFILAAIAEKADLEEHRVEFEAEAEARFAKILANGETIPWREMRSYLERRVSGKKPRRPRPRVLSR